MSDEFYRAFEEKCRCSRALIQQRLEVYLPFVNLIREENVKVDAETGQEVAVERPWWSMIASDPKPEDLIPNFCQKQEDCKEYEDNDSCNGTLYCNLAAIFPNSFVHLTNGCRRCCFIFKACKVISPILTEFLCQYFMNNTGWKRRCRLL